MTNIPIHKDIKKMLSVVTGKRSRIVVEHIIKHGFVTTEDLENYGYKHPPRAVRDVKEQGIPLDKFWTKNAQGRKIAGYRFGDPTLIRNDRLGGRKVFSKDFKSSVIALSDGKCTICCTPFQSRYLQIDHRVPYEVLPDNDYIHRNPSDYMSLCGSCNRAKSWSCEHCDNWTANHKPKICHTCYWANPNKYNHVAGSQIRRLDITWLSSEIDVYKILSDGANAKGQPLPVFVKNVLSKHFKLED